MKDIIAMMESLDVLSETATRSLEIANSSLPGHTNRVFSGPNPRKSLDLRDFNLVFSSRIFT